MRASEMSVSVLAFLGSAALVLGGIVLPWLVIGSLGLSGTGGHGQMGDGYLLLFLALLNLIPAIFASFRPKSFALFPAFMLVGVLALGLSVVKIVQFLSAIQEHDVPIFLTPHLGLGLPVAIIGSIMILAAGVQGSRLRSRSKAQEATSPPAP